MTNQILTFGTQLSCKAWLAGCGHFVKQPKNTKSNSTDGTEVPAPQHPQLSRLRQSKPSGSPGGSQCPAAHGPQSPRCRAWDTSSSTGELRMPGGGGGGIGWSRACRHDLFPTEKEDRNNDLNLSTENAPCHDTAAVNISPPQLLPAVGTPLQA